MGARLRAAWREHDAQYDTDREEASFSHGTDRALKRIWARPLAGPMVFSRNGVVATAVQLCNEFALSDDVLVGQCNVLFRLGDVIEQQPAIHESR
jgi:hypothetical protein